MSIIDLAVLLGVGGLLILAGIAIVNILGKVRESATPTVQAILDALIPWAQKAVLAGERATIEGLDEIDRQLDGTDKAAVANSIYDLLPEFVNVAGKPIPTSLIKHLITREMWADLVKRVFEEGDAFIERNRDYLKKQIPADLPLAAYTGGQLQSADVTTFAIGQTFDPSKGVS